MGDDVVEKYRFKDTGADGNEEFDIDGTYYQNLLSVCFRYCNSVSFLVECRNETQLTLLHPMEQYRIPVTSKVPSVYNHYNILPVGIFYNPEYQIRQYILCGEVQRFIRENTESLFHWLHGWGYNNPIDPAFIRADGSIFFSSLIHEGECVLYPRDDEDVSTVIANGNWYKE